MSETTKIRLNAGFCIRNRIRAGLDYHSLKWREYKGLLSSEFVAEGSREQLAKFLEWAREQ